MGIFDLGPFRRALAAEQKALEFSMAQAVGAETLAVARTVVEFMEADLKKGEAALKSFTVPDPLNRSTPPDRWRVTCEHLAIHKLYPSVRNPRQYEHVKKAYDDLARQLKESVQKTYRFLYEDNVVRQVLMVRRNLPTRQVIDRIANALDDYRAHHESDDDFLLVPAHKGLDRMLTEDRPDLAMALRLASQIPNDIETFVLEEKERPTWMTVVSVAIGFIPIIGNAVATLEAWRGVDIFGNELSDAERAIIGVSVLLPAAARLVKAGKSLYTAERMARLYGEDARWSAILGQAELLSDDAARLNHLREAEQAAAKGTKVARTAAEKLQEVFKHLGLDGSGRAVIPFTIDSKLVKAFEEVAARHPKLDGLDALAVQRIVAKAKLDGLDALAIERIVSETWVTDHVKAQILEELLENRIVKLLRDPLGHHALGLAKVEGPLYFIPGHLIREEMGNQLTDGMIVRYVKDRLHAVAVFEAKSSADVAKDLVLRKTKLSKATKTELLAVARENLGELQERARINGLPQPTTTVDDIVKNKTKDSRIKNAEFGGQFRSDIETLSEEKVWINGREVPVELQSGPWTTKWFGVLPSDVDGAVLVKSLRKQVTNPKRMAFNVEMMGLDITASELVKAAKFIIKKAADLAKP